MNRNARFAARCIAAIALIIIVLVCAMPAASAPVAITGVVRDTLGHPIKGVSARLQMAARVAAGAVVSDERGEFELITPASGKYSIVLTKKGFKRAVRSVTIANLSPVRVEIAMQPEAAISMPVVVQRREKARNALSKVTGGSSYTFDEKTIRELPQGNNTGLNQVILQAPGVAQDSYGQVHVRGEHANLQYRLNGILLPEGVSGFGQILTPRFARDITLLTGVLPAQYGLRTAGVVDIRTKDGALDPTASVEMYGGQRGTTQPSFEYGSTRGALSYFVTGNYLGTDRGLEPPTSGPTAIHDTSNGGTGFGYFSYALGPSTHLSLITGTAINHFEIPANPGQPPVYALAGVPSYPSGKIRENQFEQNYFAVAALKGLIGTSLDYQIAPFSRYSTVSFNPDHAGDLIFDGVASKVFRSDWASGFQADAAYRGWESHTVAFGGSFWGERAEIDNHAATFPAAGGVQTSSIPIAIVSDQALTSWYYSGYLGDEWKPTDRLTVNASVRFDLYDGLVRADQASPRIGVEYKFFRATRLHLAYGRYFTPPPTELVPVGAVKQFQNTTAAPPSNGNGNPTVERTHYFDAGVSQELMRGLNVGIDAYFKKSSETIDEGQFGPQLIFSTFNYKKGRIYGVELTGTYVSGGLSAYSNFAFGVAQGTQITSGQFNFARNELAYINGHYVFLDHDQTFTSSDGIAYEWRGWTASLDALYGSGLRRGFANTGNLPFYVQLDGGIARRVEIAGGGAVDFRAAIVNLNDRTYQIRNGSGIGVFAAQYGPRRALYGGIKWELPGFSPRPAGS